MVKKKKPKYLKLEIGKKEIKTAKCPVCKRVFILLSDRDFEKAQKCLTICTSLNSEDLPEFARFKHDKKADLVFRLSKYIPDEGSYYEDMANAHLEYYVDNGAWGVEPYIKDGKIYSKHEYDHLNDKELVEATKEQYIDATGVYGLKSITDPNYEPPDEMFTVDDIPF